MNDRSFTRNRLPIVALLLGLLMVGVLAWLTQPVAASIVLTVDTLQDETDNPATTRLREAIANITLDVDTTTDSNAVSYQVCSAAGSDCSLRGAISKANADTANTYTINIPAGTYTISLAGSEDSNVSGDLDVINNVTLTGAGTGSTIIDGGGIDRPFDTFIGYTITLENMTITNGDTGNSIAANGGGIYNAATLTVRNSVVSNNATVGNGGGIYNIGSGSLTLLDSTVSGNSADSGGGGVYSSSTLTVNNSTLSGNSASSSGGGGISTSGTTTVTNSTLSDNSASYGGAIAIFGGSIHVQNSTVYGNTDGIYESGGSVNVASSILTGNGGQNCINGIVSDGYNLDSDDSCGFDGTGDQSNVEPLLGSLADNGGNTQTHALLPGSPALDAGDVTCDVATDQRGVARPQGAACDIGAFEVAVAASANLVVSTLDDVENGDFSDGDNSLREAIANASDGDTITFDPALSGGTITLAGTQLTVDKDVTISATVPISVSGEANFIIFGIGSEDFNGYIPAHVTINGLAIIESQGLGIFVLEASSLTLQASTVMSNSSGGIDNEGTVTVIDTTFANNITQNSVSGIGINNRGTLTVTGSTFANNRAGGLGIIANRSGSTTVIDSTFINNESAAGGAIYNEAMLTVENSTFSSNIGYSDGGAIANHSRALIQNSTFSGNRAWTGGAIMNTSQLSLSHSTIVGNVAEGSTDSEPSGGGVFNGDSIGTLSITHTIIASNTKVVESSSGRQPSNSVESNNCNTSLTSLNYNLDSDGTCGLREANDQFNVEPLLAPLADYGGDTQTHALLPGSPAIDAGEATCGVDSDQRGLARPQGSACDIGAFEREGTDSFTAVSGGEQTTDVDTPFANPLTLTIVNSANEPVGAGGQVIFSAPVSGASIETPIITATTDVNGAVSVSVTANGEVGSYNVTTTLNGSAASATYALTNTISIPANLVVSTLDDVENGDFSDGDNSLREAIANASDGDTITFDPALSGGTITLAGTQLTVDKSVTISATVPISVSANSQSRVFLITQPEAEPSRNGDPAVHIHGLTIRDGNQTDDADGICSGSACGGGIFVNSDTALTLTHSHVISNSAGFGGGILNNGGTTSVTNSTLSANSATSNSATSFGGGIYNFDGTTSVTNSTLSANSAPNNGGGIFNFGGTTSVINSTLSANSANFGGGISNFDGTISVTNSIIANNTIGGDCTGTISSNDHNLDSDGSCGLNGTNDLSNSNPLLGALADNGGDTQTHALLPGSPALDAGGATCGVATDQRGVARPQGSACDIGAFEAEPSGFTLSAMDADKVEGDSGVTAFTFEVTRTGADQAATFDYVVTSDSADADDFAPQPFRDASLPAGSITLDAGEVTQTLTIDVAGDTTVEADETFTVTLTLQQDVRTIAAEPVVASGTIRNDDASFSIAAKDADKPEGDSDSTAFTFEVTRTGADQATTFDYVVTSDAADADDFVVPTAGRTTFLPSGSVSFGVGVLTQTITIDVAGDTAVEADETFTVTLSLATPPTRAETIANASASGTIRNDDASFSIAAKDADKPEGDSDVTAFTFDVTRTGADQAATFDYVVTSDSADGDDFALAGRTTFLPSGSVSFGVGVLTQTITVGVVGDTTVEADETFTVTLSLATPPTRAETIANASASGTIRNDDASFSIAAKDADKPEGDSDSTAFTFEVTRTGSEQAATFDYMVTSDSADGDDFALAGRTTFLPSGSVSFGVGVLTQTITIDVVGDTTVEADETFTVTLSLATSVRAETIANASASGTIRNDDASFSIAAKDADKPEGDSDVTAFTFEVTRMGADQAATLDYVVTSDSADAADFAQPFRDASLPSGSITLGAGEVTQTITIFVAGDTTIETDETFTVTLSLATPPRAETIELATATGVIRNDDDLAPTVVSTNPVSDAAEVPVTTTITVNFSEAVTVADANQITLICDGVAQTFTHALSDSQTLVLTPTMSLPAGERCDVTLAAASIADTDGIDPTQMASDYTFSFTTAVADSPASGVLQVSAFTYQADPSGNLPSGNLDGFIVVKNIGTGPISLDGYKLGDEETRGGDEGMFLLPNIELAAGAQIVVAENGDNWPFNDLPDHSFAPNSVGIPTLTRYTAWSSGSVDLDDSEDEVILLDGNDQFVDGACYGQVAGEECLVDTTAAGSVERAQTRILDDGRLLDSPTVAGFTRNSDSDTHQQSDWNTKATAVALTVQQAVNNTDAALLLVTAVAALFGLTLFMRRRRWLRRS